MRIGFRTSIAIATMAGGVLISIMAGAVESRAAAAMLTQATLTQAASANPFLKSSQRSTLQIAAIPWGGATPKTVFRAPIKRRLGGIPVIDVMFNGSRKFEMIVDTGASGTLITRAMAGALRVKIVGSVRSGIADGSVVEFPVGRLNSIAVDGAVVKNVDVAIAEQMDIGLLGHDFFGKYDMQIKQDVVEFHKRK